MLKGKGITLRPITDDDLPALYEHNLNLENRGEYFPATFMTMTELKKHVADDGFWGEQFGSVILIDNETGKLIGQMFWFKTVQYMTELEIGYIMYDTSTRARGGMTEGCKLLTRYLFHIKPVNRIRLCIVTENRPSRRVAEKSGYTHEGTQRGCFWNNGRVYDMELYAMTRADWDNKDR